MLHDWEKLKTLPAVAMLIAPASFTGCYATGSGHELSVLLPWWLALRPCTTVVKAIASPPPKRPRTVKKYLANLFHNIFTSFSGNKSTRKKH
jgi:hypothetical protein